MTRKLGALAVCITAVLALAMPDVEALPRKPFHCYWRGWSWSMLTLNYGSAVHCDRN